MSECRVWIGCLASYNAGTLYGEWFDIPDDPEELAEGIERMLSASPAPGAEEWEVMDVDGPACLSGSTGDIDRLCAIASAIDEHGEAFVAYAENMGLGDIDDDIRDHENRYRGEWDSEEAFAEDYIEQIGSLDSMPADLRWYFDMEGYARDLFINDFEFVDGHVWSTR